MSLCVLFDTETTGLDPLTGARIIEMAALELQRDLVTRVTFHRLIDPERDIDPDATRVHGLTRLDLAGKPRFGEIVDDLLAFIGAGPLVAHNAGFDFAFLNAELVRLRRPDVCVSRKIDTLELARTRYSRAFPFYSNA